MFNDWSFVIIEMAWLIIIALLLGFVAGWIMWGNRNTQPSHHDIDEKTALQLERALQECRQIHTEKDARIATMQSELDAAKAKRTSHQDTSVKGFYRD